MKNFSNTMFFIIGALFLLTTQLYAVDLEKGKAIFSQRCVSCHGESGKGDGPVGASLPANMKPADLTKVKFKVVTDDESLKNLIKNGGAAYGLSPMMPPQAGLSEEDLNNLVAYIRSLKK